MHRSLPTLDDALRRRLAARYGDEIESWLDELPSALIDLAERWGVEYGTLIPRGSMSAVFRCVLADGRPGVLKACPNRKRIGDEAAALERWTTNHVPAVYAVDTDVGALLMEAVVPGTMLVESQRYPVDAIAELVRSLHAQGHPDPAYQPVAERAAHLFDASARHRERHPELIEVVSASLFDRGHRLADRLAEQAAPTVLLHGDLTPVNILDGGTQRGLVAIDPAPCLGDPAFDAVDLLLWDASDVETVLDRADVLASTMGVAARRLVDWCVAFAAMVASERAEALDPSDARIRTALALAAQAPA